jgi:predicted exporter
MKMKHIQINFPLLFIVLIAVVMLSVVGMQRIKIDTDIVSSLPLNDPVIKDAIHLFSNHPLQDQLTIDVGLDRDDPDLLVECGQRVEQALRESELFKSVGMEDVAKGLPQLLGTVLQRLPVLFTADALESQVQPLLTPEKIAQRMETTHKSLLQMDGIGQAAAIAQDPLGLKDLVLGHLLYLAPTSNARIYKGHLLSSDGHHLLVTAVPFGSGTDTTLARQIEQTMAQVSEQVRRVFEPRGVHVVLTPVGAYRAALDNEVIVRKDVQLALWFTTLGIVVLLLCTFPRPLIGLLSLLPAMAGTVVALFVMTFLYKSISVMVLGFGGAILSITVDHGVAFFLFMDRSNGSSGKEAANEVRSASLLATLTNMGAFGAMIFSGFPIFGQLGVFAALGHFFSFLFIQLVFPYVFPSLKGSRERLCPLPSLAQRLFSFGTKGAVVGLVIFGVMACFAKPDFQVNLSGMNIVSSDSQAAEKTMLTVWGNIFGKVYLMNEAPSLEALQANGDQLLSSLEADSNSTVLEKAFLPSMFFPGPQRAADNLASWKRFWNQDRIAEVRAALHTASEKIGFTAEAFDPFLNTLADPTQGIDSGSIPAEYFALLGISAGQGSNPWRQISSLALPASYPGEQFYQRYSSMVGIFEPQLFAQRLGEMISSIFLKMLVVIVPIVVLILLLAYLNVYLSVIALLPVLFAMICTLGSLRLLGMPLDFPALILTIMILGEGLDFSNYVVTAYQRYGRESHQFFPMIRSAVLVNSGSTMVAFGVLAISQHTLLRSAGITSLMAVSYSMMGTFLLLPPLLKRYFEKTIPPAIQSSDVHARVLARYRLMNTSARMFARFKLRLDPMFTELPNIIHFATPPKVLVDIGTGFGVPACWLAEAYPTVRVYGIEPAAERVRVASLTLGANGHVVQGRAPDLPPAPAGADGAFMLDMMHYLSDSQVILTLERLRELLAAGAPLTIRAVMVPRRRMKWCWWLECLKNKLNGIEAHWRSAEQICSILHQCGYDVLHTAPSGAVGDLLWVSAVRGDFAGIKSSLAPACSRN